MNTVQVKWGIAATLTLVSLVVSARDVAIRSVNYDPKAEMDGRYVRRDVAIRGVNYDEKKVGPYVLEDPLTFVNGTKVTKETWPKRRREILEIFAHEMYGVEPPKPEALVTELANEKVTGGGFAIRRQYDMWFRADKSGPSLRWIVWLPRHAKKPVPVISFLNYYGNHELVPDQDIPARGAGHRGRRQDPNGDTIFPLGMLMARGYAVMSTCYECISPDLSNTNAYTGIFALWGERDYSRQDNTTSLGAWAWTLSRGLDLAERLPEIDAKRSVVTGFSRLGKTALLAAARDERFAVCMPVQTGGGGCPLAKRDFGENISTENQTFTHWFCPAYAKYAADPAKLLTFDQHLLLASIAPRALLVSGYNEGWFDTKGEFLAAQAASPAWELLTGSGLPKVAWPENYDTCAIGSRLGYVRRTEGHGISGHDWTWLLDFSDGVFGIRRR